MKTLFIIFILLFSTHAISGAVVVVHPSNDSQITLSDIKKLYLGKKSSFKNGVPATLAILKEGNDLRKMFNTNILNKSEAMYTGYWAKLNFTGQATAPLDFADSDSMKQFVANNPNAIGIIDDELVDDSVKVVANF